MEERIAFLLHIPILTPDTDIVEQVSKFIAEKMIEYPLYDNLSVDMTDTSAENIKDNTVTFRFTLYKRELN